jgi:hypothetical protein
MKSLVQLIKTTYKNSSNPFTDVCDHLMSYYYEEQWSRNRELLAHPTSSRPRPVRSNVVMRLDSDSDESTDKNRMASYGQQYRQDDLRVSDAWWKDATPVEHEILKQMRSRIKARRKEKREQLLGGKQGQKEISKEGDQQRPLQKTYAQRAVSHDYPVTTDLYDEDDHDSAVDQMNELEHMMEDVFGYMARTTDQDSIRCHVEYDEYLANLSKMTKKAYATADSGADTTILGKEWLIIAQDPVRRVNLVGFDPRHARKQGLAIVTADNIVATETGNEIIIRVHQAVLNPTTSTRLLSENQLRHAGHVVDSVHKDHLLSINGEKGTQTLYLKMLNDGEDVIYKIPFLLRSGLMTIPHRKPDKLDYNRGLPIVPITLEANWNPRAHYYDHGTPMLLSILEGSFKAQRSTTEQIPQCSHPLSSWYHSETYSVFQAHGDQPETFYDASQGTGKQFYGLAFHLDIPQHWRKHRLGPHIHYLRQYHIDEFLATLSYHELLGF